MDGISNLPDKRLALNVQMMMMMMMVVVVATKADIKLNVSSKAQWGGSLVFPKCTVLILGLLKVEVQTNALPTAAVSWN
jgi:hypothetical protein